MAGTPGKRSVGRPREFDEEAVLSAAMDAFWRQGYEATSLADLCNCTGLHKGSLYQTFGDKHQLFMKSLQHYCDSMFRDVAAAAYASDSPLENIRAVMRTAVGKTVEDQGCLMVNSLVELAPHDPDVKAALQTVAGREIRMLSDLVAKAQQAGEINSAHDPERVARQLMVTLAGIGATIKGFIGADEAMQTMDDTIASLI